MALFVYVATTQGLVQVQGITEEDPEIDSLVCLNGSMQQLPISRNYHQFVKKGSGLIHKDFNHGTFRLDVDKPIDSGKSWQLGFYLAHYAASQLNAGTPQSGDIVVWATGEVKIDKSLSQVAGVGQKCQQSASQLQQWLGAGVKLLCVLPKDNEGDIEPVEGVNFLVCDTLFYATDALDGLLDGTGSDKGDDKVAQKEALEQEPVVNKSKWYKWPLLAVGLAGVAGLFVWFSGHEMPMDDETEVKTASINDEKNTQKAPNNNLEQSLEHDSQQSPEQNSQQNLKQDNEKVDRSRPFLRARVKSTSGCDDANSADLQLKDARFESIRLDSLCQLELMLPKDNMQVMGIALDTGIVIPVDGPFTQGQGTSWDIPIPTSKYQNRDYLLLLFDESFFAGGRNPLISQMRRWRWDDKSLSARLIEDWVVQNNWPVVVYRHRLEDD